MSFRRHIHQLLLEKDNRPKILKMGLSQEVADYLHQIHDKYSLWFADKLKKMPAFMSSRNQLQYIHNMQTAITGILDWIRNTPNIQINNYSWDQALSAEKEYHDGLKVSDLNLEENTIIKKYDDGFYWVDLESTSDNDEASAMGHCATTHKGETLYSLRAYNKATKNIEPFITISVSPDEGQWHQCKGKRNSKPKKEYYRYIADILIHKNIFRYKSEYDSGNDFGPRDFLEYVEENEDTIPNADEITNKIKEDLIDHSDFEKILTKYDFVHFDIQLDDDSDSGVYITPSFHTEIKRSYTDLPFELMELKNEDALSYFLNAIDVHMTNVEVEDTNDGISIRGDIEDSDNSFTLDEDGLNSFRQSCEYYKGLDNKFEIKSFIEDHLEKILILDGCIEDELGNFEEKVRDELGSDFTVVRDKKSLDLNITSDPITVNITKNQYASSSLFRSNYQEGVIIKSPKYIKEEPGYKPVQHADLMIYSLFWNFIKNNVLQIKSQNFRTVYNGTRREFSFKFHFDFDEQYDMNWQFSDLEKISTHRNMIKKSYNKFEDEVIIPFLENAEKIDLDNITTRIVSTYGHTLTLQAFNKGIYIGMITGVNRQKDNDELPDPKSLKENIKAYLEENNITGDYPPLDEEYVMHWLRTNIPHQMSFAGFMENYLGYRQGSKIR